MDSVMNCSGDYRSGLPKEEHQRLWRVIVKLVEDRQYASGLRFREREW